MGSSPPPLRVAISAPEDHHPEVELSADAVAKHFQKVLARGVRMEQKARIDMESDEQE